MKEKDLNQLIGAYIKENIKEIRPLSGGHINKSFLIRANDTYVLQVLNTDLFKNHQDKLKNNYEEYTIACEKYKRESGQWDYPVWIKNTEGDYFKEDDDGNILRIYRYLPADDKAKKTDHHEIGKGLGRLHTILDICVDIENIESISHLHDLSYYYGEYEKQATNRKNDGIKRLESQIDKDIDHFLKIKVPGGNIIHGDAKTGNMILRDGKVTGFIDLDTIMRGSYYDDLADCIRSCCFYDGILNKAAFKELILGYEEEKGITFSGDEMDLILMNCKKNLFTLGLRYYTDYLSGMGYFNEEYPGQSLDKAKYLFSLYLTGFKGIIQ